MNDSSIFAKYAPKTKTQTEDTRPSTTIQEILDSPAPESYQAFGLDKGRSKQTRLRLHKADGEIEVINYAYIMRYISTSHQYLTLICTDGVINLEGKHLNRLIEPLQDEQIRWLQCFESNGNLQPVEGEPIITNIERMMLGEV